MNRKITIAGTGCCLVDRIYPEIDFSGQQVQPLIPRKKGDGGLYPGRLVFSEQFGSFAGEALEKVIGKIAAGTAAPLLNVGGPSIVSLVHAAQLLQDRATVVRFYGARGDDAPGAYLWWYSAELRWCPPCTTISPVC